MPRETNVSISLTGTEYRILCAELDEHARNLKAERPANEPAARIRHIQRLQQFNSIIEKVKS